MERNLLIKEELPSDGDTSSGEDTPRQASEFLIDQMRSLDLDELDSQRVASKLISASCELSETESNHTQNMRMSLSQR